VEELPPVEELYRLTKFRINDREQLRSSLSAGSVLFHDEGNATPRTLLRALLAQAL
jgi:hypothetical protein